MDPKTAKMLIELAHPRRRGLEPADAEAVDRALRDHPDLADEVRRDERVHEVFARAMQDVPVPDGLRGRILDRLAEERGRWYRRRMVQVAAAAAAVLLAVLLVREGGNHRRLDPEMIAQQTANRIQPRQEEVHRWLHEQGVGAGDPVPFNYQLMASYGMAEFQGRSVPSMLFINYDEKAFLQVFVVRTRQFDLQRVEGRPFSNGPCTVEVRPAPDRPGYAFVLIYTSTLDKFLAPPDTRDVA
jgi:hypothetical protein